MLLEAGLISINQLEVALKEHKESGLKIGEVLVINGWVSQQTVDFFAEQWKKIIQESNKRPLIYYFQESGLLSENQVKDLLSRQEHEAKKIRFHHLVVEKNLLKQITVDYFLTYLFGFYKPSTNSLEKSYEILRNYLQGKMDFSHSDLPKVPFMNVSLTGIKLNNSNLRKANFCGANLSYSSLVAANLCRADLSQAMLKEANLEQTNLKKANLKHSNLEKANINQANLQGADLRNTNLSGTSLKNTNFSQANLQGADLRNTDLSRTSFEFSNLQGAIIMPQNSVEVYYNDRTIFDDDFSPEEWGWKKLEIKEEVSNQLIKK